MSWTAMPNAMNQGVRRLHTLGALWGLGTDPQYDTLAELQDAGWNPGRLQILQQLGATNEQLQALPYPASEDEMTAAYNALALQLSQLQSAASGPMTGTEFQNAMKASG